MASSSCSPCTASGVRGITYGILDRLKVLENTKFGIRVNHARLPIGCGQLQPEAHTKVTKADHQKSDYGAIQLHGWWLLDFPGGVA